jgi:hypothetical protein
MARLVVCFRRLFPKAIGERSLGATASPLGSCNRRKERSIFYLVIVRSFHTEFCIPAELLQGNFPQNSYDWRLVGSDNEKKIIFPLQNLNLVIQAVIDHITRRAKIFHYPRKSSQVLLPVISRAAKTCFRK